MMLSTVGLFWGGGGEVSVTFSIDCCHGHFFPNKILKDPSLSLLLIDVPSRVGKCSNDMYKDKKNSWQ